MRAVWPNNTQFAFQCCWQAGWAIRDVHFTAGLYCSLSPSNEGKQSTIKTLEMVVVFKLGKPGDLRIVTRLHHGVLAKKIPEDEN